MARGMDHLYATGDRQYIPISRYVRNSRPAQEWNRYVYGVENTHVTQESAFGVVMPRIILVGNNVCAGPFGYAVG